MNLKANNYISEKEYNFYQNISILSEHQSAMD